MYTPENPPKRGNAKKLWDDLKTSALGVTELHYNFGRYGTWAFKCNHSILPNGAFCGIKSGRVYVQELTAPYTMFWLDEFDKVLQ